MKPLLPSKPGTAYEVRRTARTETGVDEASRIAAAPGPLASFARFILCGGSVGLACGPAVALLAALMPWALANALVTAASTILCTQLHARFTFEAGRRAGWRQHWQSAGSASAGYAVTCAVMFILHMVKPSAGTLSEQAVYLSASGLAGIGRFLVLRLFVFAGSPTTVQENSPAGVQEASESASWPIATPAWPKATQSASERASHHVRPVPSLPNLLLFGFEDGIEASGVGGTGRPQRPGAVSDRRTEADGVLRQRCTC
ncbi:putative flippase GtrA [Streptomyces sp. Ag82_O1-15]|uniref:GtrA family protein n=1 Tax=Streptomyces sp. Ag82_O1-15 TaxID=1938855 RepID=UPI000BCD4FAF|nr:putative flippase GtrA [Streptomyces sp. Ag82_O1-15]